MTEAATFELVAIAMAIGFVLIAPKQARPIHAWVMRLLGRLAARPWLACLVLGLGTAGLAAIGAAVVHWPQPSIHDEFAYLLGAETFAGGELARPPHPCWTHFETFHILQQPSYAPKYPPGQSLALAAGMVVTGELRAGLWIECGAMVAALLWMLFQWLPRRFAMLGGILIAMHLGVRGPWVQTFYGGAVAATGGALMLGAVPRIVTRRSTWAALVLALGLGLIALTRPFEGLVASLPVAAVLAYHWFRDPGRLRFAMRIALPIIVVLTGLLTWIGFHNQAVTGDATVLPYVAYDAEYSVYPPFIWQEVYSEPEYRHAPIRHFMLNFQRGAHGISGPFEWLGLMFMRQWHLVAGLLGSALALMLLAGGAALAWGPIRRKFPSTGGRSLALPLAIVAVVGLASATTTYAAPRYAAPALGALLILLMSMWRRVLIAPRRSRERGAAIAMAAVLVLVAVTLDRGSKRWLGGARYFGVIRAEIVAGLMDDPGRDLVLVDPSSKASAHREFVFNAADIDGSPIVWARDLGDDGNAALLLHFEGRNVWRLKVGSLAENRWSLDRVHTAPTSDIGDLHQNLRSDTPRWGAW